MIKLRKSSYLPSPAVGSEPYLRAVSMRRYLRRPTEAASVRNASRMTRRTVLLRTVQTVDEDADVLDPPFGVVPAYTGEGEVNLACGRCNTVIVEGTRGLEILDRPTQWLVMCPTCRIANILPIKTINQNSD
jgi:hypothetical protein